MDVSTLGAFVSQRRKELGLRQQDLADFLGYTVQAVSKFEKGQSSLDLAALPPLAKRLSLSLDDLLHQRDDPASKPCSIAYQPQVLASNLVYLRKMKGLSRETAAKIGQVPPRRLANYETGRAQPPLSCLFTYLNYYDVKADDFFGLILSPKGEASLPKNKKGKAALLIPLILCIVLVSGGSGYGIYLAVKKARVPVGNLSSNQTSSSHSSEGGGVYSSSNDAPSSANSSSVSSSASSSSSSSSSSSASFTSTSNPSTAPLYIDGNPSVLLRGKSYNLKQTNPDLSYPLRYPAFKFPLYNPLYGESFAIYIPYSTALLGDSLPYQMFSESSSYYGEAYAIPVANNAPASISDAITEADQEATNFKMSAEDLGKNYQPYDDAIAYFKNLGDSKGYFDTTGSSTYSETCPDSFKKEYEETLRQKQIYYATWGVEVSLGDLYTRDLEYLKTLQA